MKIQIKNFGDILMSRPAGREDFLKAQSYVFNELKPDEVLYLDFSDVKVLAPSWADEFITGIKNNYNNKIEYINTDNESVTDTLKFLSH